MLELILGLILFFAMHSVSIVAPAWRDQQAAKNVIAWRAFYSIISLIGIILISRGYADLRQVPTLLYTPAPWLRHVAALLLLPVFIFFLAPYFPGRIKQALQHPQLVALKLWAFAHLLVNGTLADVLLFGSFLVWAVADRISMKQRVARVLPGAPASKANDFILIIAGLVLYAIMVFWLHGFLFGIQPFG